MQGIAEDLESRRHEGALDDNPLGLGLIWRAGFSYHYPYHFKSQPEDCPSKNILKGKMQTRKLLLDPTVMPNWQIAEEAEKGMKDIRYLAQEWGVNDAELIPYGRHTGKIDYAPLLSRLSREPNGKYIDITGITPTPLGEGKSTTTIGLVQGLGRRGKMASAAIRQASAGPTFNVKGSAAGGGLAQCIPLPEFSLGLTGDIDCVSNAHNLAMVALTSRLQHEFNHDDNFLAQRNLRRLDIDPRRVELSWVMDFCAQSLRNIIIGLGNREDSFPMQSGFAISVSSELMSILSLFNDLKDLRERISRIVVAYNKKGEPVTTRDLEVDGAMAAWMVRATNPNLLQTIEGEPVLVHAGPFANISIGQSSIIADRVGLKLSAYHVTESGFGADIGFEKFWNIKCRLSGLKPDCAVIVATIRGLKMHGGGPAVVVGRPLDRVYREKHTELVEKGCDNLRAHIEIVKRSGISPVVCINRHSTDTEDELNIVKDAVQSAGVRVVTSEHWLKGGEGALELADAVLDACSEGHHFDYLYPLGLPLREKIETIAQEVYGAQGVSFSNEAQSKLDEFGSDPTLQHLPVCMLKTHLSLSHDPALKGRPREWILPVRDIQLYRGAGLIVPVAGNINLMPGTSSDPAFRYIDIDTDTGKVTGLR